jgi:cytochrome b6-f complex iron-sulfur subunit
MSELNRREFVIAASAAVCACIGGCASDGGQGVWTGPTTFQLPPPAEIKQGIDTRWVQSGGFFLVRDNGRIFAVSSTCSHRACPLAPKGTEYVCPCHGSRFTPAGKVLVGPATTPLARFGTSINAAGHLFVDRNKIFPEAQWDQSGAFVAV